MTLHYAKQHIQENKIHQQICKKQDRLLNHRHIRMGGTGLHFPSLEWHQSIITGGEKQGRCEPQTCLYPSPVNGTTWCNCQPLLASLPGPPSNSKHWAVSTGLWEEEGSKGESRKIRKGGVGRTFHSAGQCIQGDSCHRSAGRQNPDSRWRRICTDRGPRNIITMLVLASYSFDLKWFISFCSAHSLLCLIYH